MDISSLSVLYYSLDMPLVVYRYWVISSYFLLDITWGCFSLIDSYRYYHTEDTFNWITVAISFVSDSLWSIYKVVGLLVSKVGSPIIIIKISGQFIINLQNQLRAICNVLCRFDISRSCFHYWDWGSIVVICFILSHSFSFSIILLL